MTDQDWIIYLNTHPGIMLKYIGSSVMNKYTSLDLYFRVETNILFVAVPFYIYNKPVYAERIVRLWN